MICYSGNRAAANKVGEIAIAGCWAHVTRKLRDAEKEAPGTAKLIHQQALRSGSLLAPLFQRVRDNSRRLTFRTGRGRLFGQDARSQPRVNLQHLICISVKYDKKSPELATPHRSSRCRIPDFFV